MAIDGSKEKTSLRPSIDTSILPYRPQSFTYDQIHYTSGGAPVQKQGFAPHGGGRTQQIAGCRSIFFAYRSAQGKNSAADIRKKNRPPAGVLFLLSKSELPADSLYRLQVGDTFVHIAYKCTYILYEICAVYRYVYTCYIRTCIV